MDSGRLARDHRISAVAQSAEPADVGANDRKRRPWLVEPSYPLLDEPDADVERDRYGNDVSTAVATYKSDRTGSLYEEHSPNTQVARLKPPTT